MLRKLLKYELLSTSRAFGVSYVGMLAAAVLDPPHPVRRPAKRAAASAAASQCFLCFIWFPSLFFGKTTKISR